MMHDNDSGLSPEQNWKEGGFMSVSTASALIQKEWGPVRRHTVQPIDRLGETRKKANCSTLRRRITR